MTQTLVKREAIPVDGSLGVDRSGFQSSEVKTKICPSCGRELPLDSFLKQNHSADGHMKECKECRRNRRTEGTSKSNPLAKFTARELMHELRLRGYDGEIKYTEVKVHKMKLSEM